MKEIITVILLLCSILAFGQSANFRAQGKYYSAKENYENEDYSSAIEFIIQSKTLLKGTNYRLQYLHILSAYDAGKYKEAQIELATYFDILDGKVIPIGFQKTVERLSSDETKALTKLIDKIDTEVANRTEEKNNLKKCTSILLDILNYRYKIRYSDTEEIEYSSTATLDGQKVYLQKTEFSYFRYDSDESFRRSIKVVSTCEFKLADVSETGFGLEEVRLDLSNPISLKKSVQDYSDPSLSYTETSKVSRIWFLFEDNKDLSTILFDQIKCIKR